MQESEIYTRLTTIFRDQFDDDTLVLTPSTSAAAVPGWDSFNHINVILATESVFGIKFKSSELDQMDNVGAMVELIQHKLAG